MWPGSQDDDSILKTKTPSGLKVLCHLIVQDRSEKGQQPKGNREVGDPAGSRTKVNQSRKVDL